MNPPVFGRLITAMVTPMDSSGALDLDRAGQLAERLVDEQGCDGLVVNGTTGESPTTSDTEKADLVRAVGEAVGDRAHVIAGVGTNDTAHTVHLAQQARQAGADGLLVVTPYYSRPSQEGVLAHFRTVADATDLPVMVYDIPSRTATPVATPTMLALAEHPRIVAVKDAKGQVVESAAVMAATDLAYYAGDDAITPALLSMGAVGLVGTSTHFTGRRMREVIENCLSGRREEALATYREILPVLTGVFAAQGVVMVKSGLRHQGFDAGSVRAPLVEAPDEVVRPFLDLLDSTSL